jgi:hypothetical protein
MRAPLAILAASVLALAPAPGRGETITVTAATCAALAAHVPAPDVAYRPGVDVDGNPVTPADLGGTPEIKVPESFSIAITVEIAHRLGIPAFPDPANPQNDIYKPEASIGVVTYTDGRFEFNGQPLEDDAQAALAALCQKRDGNRR